MKFLRVIRFDESDDHVFDETARPDEWAVPGGFAFAGIGSSDLVGKVRQAFANGFLGLPSFGRTTFAAVSDMTDDEHGEVVACLAGHFETRYGAPSRDAAMEAAVAEASFVADLCAGEPINTVFTLRRLLDEDGEVREEFRIITPPSQPIHTRVWEIVDDNG